MVMQKTYAVSKSALVPLVVRSEEELVEANSKLSLISGVVGALVHRPARRHRQAQPLSVRAGRRCYLFGLATLWPLGGCRRDVVAASPAQTRKKRASCGRPASCWPRVRWRSSGRRIGFLTFHLLFWLRDEYGLVQFGLAAAAATIGSMLGNVVAPTLRRSMREERDAHHRTRPSSPAPVSRPRHRRAGHRDRARVRRQLQLRDRSARVRLDRATRCTRREPGPRLRPLRDPLPAGVGARRACRRCSSRCPGRSASSSSA